MGARKTSLPFKLGRILFGLAVLWLAGFLLFLAALPTPPDMAELEPADGIVVLTGSGGRLAAAAELLVDQKGQRLLISGVHQSVVDADIVRLTNVTPTLAECCIDVDRISTNTVSNAEKTAEWATGHGYTSIYLVTSDYHILRSSLLLAQALPDCEILTYPVVSDISTQGLFIEYSKLVVTYARTILSV